ncbi:MAG: hypothetical protein RLZZ518_1506, partial [Actinomycetota bacterium]
FFFVESLERSIVSLVESPIFVRDWHGLTQCDECAATCFSCPCQQRCVDHVAAKARCTQGVTGRIGFSFALATERHIMPTREQIALIPCALSVAQDHQCSRGGLRFVAHAARLERTS